MALGAWRSGLIALDDPPDGHALVGACSYSSRLLPVRLQVTYERLLQVRLLQPVLRSCGLAR